MRFPTLVRQRIRRPLVALHVSSAGRSTMTDALIDTGADISIFPKFVADRLRLDLTGLPEIAVNAPLGGGGNYRLCEVELELRRPGEVANGRSTREQQHAVKEDAGTHDGCDFVQVNPLGHVRFLNLSISYNTLRALSKKAVHDLVGEF